MFKYSKLFYLFPDNCIFYILVLLIIKNSDLLILYSMLYKKSQIYIVHHIKYIILYIFKLYNITMVNIEKISIMNPWWSKGKNFWYADIDISTFNDKQTFIEFERLNAFYKKLKPNNIFLIKGPRRVGKTLLLKLLIKRLLDDGLPPLNIFYFSFDSMVTKKELCNMLRDFLIRPTQNQKYILLDEVQSVDGWEEIVKILYDSGMLTSSVVVVTGSISHLLKSEMLPGRGVEGNTVFLRPLSFRDFVIGLISDFKSHYGVNRVNKILGYEFSDQEMENLYTYLEGNSINLEENLKGIYKKMQEIMPYSIPILKLFDIYLNTGGYPISINDYLYHSYYRNKEEDTFGISNFIYEEIYNYAKQDAAIIGGNSKGDPNKASRIIEGVINKVGMAVSYSSMAKKASMNTSTVINYFDRLQNSFVFSLIYGINKSFIDMEKRKIYFSDILMHYACGAASSGTSGYTYTINMLNSSSVGTIVEELVLSNLIKTKEKDPMKTYEKFIKFYNDNGEIDFLYKTDKGGYIGIEVKYKNLVQSSKIKKIKGISDYLILSKDILEPIDNGFIIPVSLFLLLLKKSEYDL